MEDRSSPGRRKRGTGEEGSQERRGERGSQRTGKRARTDRGPSTRNRDDRPERGGETQRSAATTVRPSEITFPRREPTETATPQQSRRRAGSRRDRADSGTRDTRRLTATRGWPHARSSGKADGMDGLEPGPNEGQRRIRGRNQAAEIAKQADRETQRARIARPESAKHPRRSPTTTTPCWEPRVSRQCAMHPTLLQGGLAVGTSGIACRVVTVPSASQLPTR